MRQNSFERKLNLLSVQLENLREYCLGRDVPDYCRSRLKQADDHLVLADGKNQIGKFESAWLYLVDVAWDIGYLSGEQNAIFEASTEEAVRNQLRMNAQKGGKIKGVNSEDVRSKIARKLVGLAPNGKWPSRAAFDIAYHKVSRDTPGFSGSEYHRLKLLKRADIQATLPAGKKRKR